MKTNKKRGGKRAGAGRKKKEDTTVLPFRVPARKARILKIKIKKLIDDTK